MADGAACFACGPTDEAGCVTPSPELTDCTPGKGNLSTGAAAATGGQATGACGGTPDPGSAEMAVIGTSEAIEEGTIIFDTDLTESATVSGQGRARQTDREIAGLI